MVDLGQLNIPDALPGLEGVPPYALVSDNITERSLASGNQPSWEVRVRDEYSNHIPVRVITPQGSINLRIDAPTDAEVRAMPAWKDHIKSEEDTVRFRRELQRELAASPLGGAEGAVLSDQILGETSQPVHEAVVTEAVQEPDEIVSEVSRDTPPPAPNGKKLPRGIRNLNPGNIKRNKIVWEGMAEDQGGDNTFVVFSELKFGIRALARIMQTYQNKHGLNTVGTIISRWAPVRIPKQMGRGDKNSTGAYMRSVAKKLGVRIDQQIDVSDDATMRGLVAGIIQHENGVQPYADSVLDEAIALAR